LLFAWNSNNAAPDAVLANSLGSIHEAARQSRHNVTVTTCPWRAVQGNPFPETLAKYTNGPGHLNIVRQIRQAIAATKKPLSEFDAICFLEHDVLYPPGYFDLVGDAFARNPAAPVVSHRDYIGLNGTGWLACVERHEPLHQLSVRAAVAEQNLDRCEREAKEHGSTELEPDPWTLWVDGVAVPQQPDRSKWARIEPESAFGLAPAVHINHPHRLTSHGEVCYQKVSAGADGRPIIVHPYWGDRKDLWVGELIDPPGCTNCPGGTEAVAKVYAHIEIWFKEALTTPSDFHEHVATLRSFAEKCQHVTEFCEWGKPARVSLAAGCPGNFISYASVKRPEWPMLKRLLGDRFNTGLCPPNGPPIIDETDMLFVDTKHHSHQETYPLLEAHHLKVRRYMAIHTTEVYGEAAADGTPGVMHSVRLFVRTHPEWKVVHYTKENNGFIVLSKAAEDRVALPPVTTLAKNFIVAKLTHFFKKREYLPLPMAEERLQECLVCPERQGGQLR
jgi:hypothetical protein